MNRFEKLIVHGGTLVAGLSGIAFAIFKYLYVNTDPFTAFNHPLQPWALKVHVFSAPFLVFGVGIIFKDHVIAKWRNGAPPMVKKIGLITMAIFVPMVATGYLLQMIVDPALLFWTAWVHVGLGALFLLAYAVHLLSVAGRIAAKNAARKRFDNGETPLSLTLAGKDGASSLRSLRSIRSARRA
jgi:hypothetical protein